MKMRASIDPAVVLFAILTACSGEVASPPSTVPGAPVADVLDPIAGVADPGADPAVVSVEGAGALLCAAALLAPDVALTSRACISSPGLPAPPSATDPEVAPCPALGPLRDASSLGILVGDAEEAAVLRARGRSVLLPAGSGSCGADVALLLLDRPITDIQPLVVRTTGVARGDHVRTVGFGRLSGAVVKVVRDHVAVVATTASEILLREAPCESGCGGPVIDEASGDVVGVVWGPLANGPSGVGGDVGLRTDAFLAVIQQALAEGAPVGSGMKAKEKKGPIDMGDNCSASQDCAAGVCVTDGPRRYCSRTCAAADRCPAGFRCERSAAPAGTTESPASVCIESRFSRPGLRRRREADKLKVRVA